MNNDNELHDVSFKIRYPNKKRKNYICGKVHFNR